MSDELIDLTREQILELAAWAYWVGIPAIRYYAKDGSVGSHTSGHGDSSDHISFYYGLKVKPQDVFDLIPDEFKDQPIRRNDDGRYDR